MRKRFPNENPHHFWNRHAIAKFQVKPVGVDSSPSGGPYQFALWRTDGKALRQP